MANKFFPRGAQKVLGASINLATDTIKAALVPRRIPSPKPMSIWIRSAPSWAPRWS